MEDDSTQEVSSSSSSAESSDDEHQSSGRFAWQSPLKRCDAIGVPSSSLSAHPTLKEERAEKKQQHATEDTIHIVWSQGVFVPFHHVYQLLEKAKQQDRLGSPCGGCDACIMDSGTEAKSLVKSPAEWLRSLVWEHGLLRADFTEQDMVACLDTFRDPELLAHFERYLRTFLRQQQQNQAQSDAMEQDQHGDANDENDEDDQLVITKMSREEGNLKNGVDAHAHTSHATNTADPLSSVGLFLSYAATWMDVSGDGRTPTFLPHYDWQMTVSQHSSLKRLCRTLAIPFHEDCIVYAQKRRTIV